MKGQYGRGRRRRGWGLVMQTKTHNVVHSSNQWKLFCPAAFPCATMQGRISLRGLAIYPPPTPPTKPGQSRQNRKATPSPLLVILIKYYTAVCSNII
jgi:hypothetical protein